MSEQSTGFICGYCGKWMPKLGEVKFHFCGPMKRDSVKPGEKPRVER